MVARKVREVSRHFDLVKEYKMKGWKTAAFAFAITTLGGAQAFFQSVEMDPATQGYVLIGIGGAIAALRAVTSTPMFEK